MQRLFVLTDRSNEQLLAGAKHLVGEERKTTAYLIAHLAEIDARGLHLAEGFSCLSKYCMEALGLSEDASYRRADASFLAQRYPIVLEMLAEGSIHLTTLRIIGGCLTNENHKRVLNAARHKSKSKLELLKASLCPQPDVPAMLRKLPGSGPESDQTQPMNELFASGPDDMSPPVAVGGSASPWAAGTAVAVDGVVVQDANVASTVEAPAPVRKLTPLSPQRYKLQLTVDEETYDALRQLQDLLRHQVRNGDLAVIVKDAVLQRLDRVQRERFGQVKRPRKASGQTGFISEPNAEVSSSQNPHVNSRHIPSNVKRSVWKRDQGRCAFVSSNGRRCSERGRLEYHHLKAYALGGPATIENIALRCRAHNTHEGVQLFGGNRKTFTGAGASPKAGKTRGCASGPGATGAGASDG